MKVTEDLLKDALRYGKAFTKFGKTAQYIPELRAVNHLDQRLSEVRRLGFTKCVVPKRRSGKLDAGDGLTLLQADNIGEAIRIVLGKA